MTLITSAIALSLLASTAHQTRASPTPNFQARCEAFSKSLELPDTNTTITYVPANTTVNVGTSVCGTQAFTAIASLCRVEATVRTSPRSQVQLEAFLPDGYADRFLGTGNGGLTGCIFYDDLNVGAGFYGMASVSTNMGHWGNTAVSFLNNTNVLLDFGWRALEVQHDVGKAIVSQYYASAPAKSYYHGCSEGGRQAMYNVQAYPGNYDGVIAGAPALDQFRWVNSIVRLGLLMGVRTNPQDSKLIIGLDDLPLITNSTLEQCDTLDGVQDGVIDEPDKCRFDAAKIACSDARMAAGNTTGVCLTSEQVKVMNEFFTPYVATDGVEFPRFDPGMTGSQPVLSFGNGLSWGYALEFYRHAVYNDTNFNIDNLTAKEMAYAQSLDFGNLSTWNTNIEPFRQSGAKLLSYHGNADQILPSGNTNRYYNEVSKTLGLSTTQVDKFWKHFNIPGMAHCQLGTGPVSFGQYGNPAHELYNDPKENIVWSLVNWVENGVAPDSIVGSEFVNATVASGVKSQRTFCPYPKRSVLKEGADTSKASSWECVY